MDQFTYCTKVCGGKCCYLHFPGEDAVKCPNLLENNACGVYAKRYGSESPEPVLVVGYWETKKYKDLSGKPVRMPFWCGQIKDIIASGRMRKDIEDQCCFAHPELLEEKA